MIVFFLLLSLAFGDVLKELGIEVVEERSFGNVVELVVERSGKKAVLYTCGDRRYILVGTLIDTKTGENLTKKRYKEITRVDVSKIPTDSAIRITFGSGGKKLIMVSDPDCPFSRRAHAYLKNKDVDLYVFLFPLREITKSVKILCSEDRARAYDVAISGGEIKGDTCKEGEELLRDHVLTGQILKTEGTPLFITEEGYRIEGFIVSELEEYLR